MKTEIPIEFKSRGYYSLTVLDKEGCSIEDKCSKAPVDNTITYEGAYVSLIRTGNYILFSPLNAALGTGTAERTRSSTSLGNESPGRSGASTSTAREGNEVDNGDGTSTLTLTRVFTFGLGEKVGTFSEVGIYTSASGGTFIAGQLIKDEFGNPTTVTILEDEQLVVTYTLEWVVPNTSKLVGTGIVTDNASNTYDYEIWAQPYFANYAVGHSGQIPRYFTNVSHDEIAFRGADGMAVLGTRVDTGSGFPSRVSLGVDGLVSVTSEPYTYSPSSQSFTDCVFMGFYTSNADSSNEGVVDTANVLGTIQTNNFSSAPPVYVKFLNPVSKTNSQSFSIQIEFEIQV